MTPSPNAGRKRTGRIVVIVLLVIGAAAAVKYGRHHLIAKRFAEVVPGHLYRAGAIESGPLRQVIGDYHIRTILTLLNREAGDAQQQSEEAIAREKGVTVLRIGMPGDGTADFDLLEQAAAILADETKHPLLVHCHAGVNRTGAVYAVWRMKYCGWDAERAIAEAEAYGYSTTTNAPMREHLRRYHADRITASRPSQIRADEHEAQPAARRQPD